MKNCTDCKHALWERTAAGKLHPSGDGKCQYPWKMPELPAALYWLRRPEPSGGFINRRRDNAEHCAYWARVA
jgi:hypothetical protein